MIVERTSSKALRVVNDRQRKQSSHNVEPSYLFFFFKSLLLSDSHLKNEESERIIRNLENSYIPLSLECPN